MSALVRLTFDEALTHYIGEFGRGQKQIIAIAALLAIPNGLIFLLWVMVTIDPIKTRAWECVDPGDAACSAVWAAPSSQAFCQLPSSAWQWTHLDSLVAKFNVICSDSWKIQFANSLMFIGCFLGSGLFGSLSDRIGRKIPLFTATAIAAAATFVSVAAPSYWFVAAMRLIVGMGAAGQVQGIVLLTMETTGRSYRGIAGVPQVIMFCMGEFLLVALAYVVPNWRSLTLAAGAICAAALVLYPVVPESARWLMSQEGKQDKAIKILRNISARNGSRMPELHLLVSQSTSILHRSHTTLDIKDASLMVPQQQRCKSMPVIHIKSEDCLVSGGSNCSSSTENCHSSSSSSNCNQHGNSSSNDALALGKDVDSQQHADRNALATAEAVAMTAAMDTPVTSDGVAAAPIGLLQLLRQPALALMSGVMVLTWFSNFLAFYILALGTGGLPGSIYVTFALNVTSQTVATLLAGTLVDILGRHNVISISLMLGGISCMSCANAASKTAQIVLATIGQFGCTASLAVTPTYTAELYPTPIRSTALGICNKACRLGSISAPFMLMLGASAGVGSAIFLPYMICGSVCLCAGVLVLLMPETLGKDMPETMEDLHQLKTICSAKPWQQGGCLATLAFLFRMRSAPKSSTEAAHSAGTTIAAPVVQDPEAGEARQLSSNKYIEPHHLAAETAIVTTTDAARPVHSRL